MKRFATEVLGYLAGNENIEGASLNDLQKLVDENPYFPVAHFLLAKKLKVEKSNNFLKQSQKTALYFSNPYWLHYQLSETAVPGALPEEDIFIGKKIESGETPATGTLAANEDVQSVSSGVIDNSPKQPLSEKRQISEEEIELNQGNDLKSEGYLYDDNIGVILAEEENADTTRDTDPSATAFLDQLNTSDETFTRDNIDQVILETQSPADFEITEVIEEMAGTSRETEETTEQFLKEAATESEETQEDLLFRNDNQPKERIDLQHKLDKDESEVEGDIKAEPDEHERMFQNIKAMLDATNEEADANVEDGVITIDPYYTIDYFASQGIKLELEKDPKDQLGQNLKKFTQWLRHMKKLGPEDATEVIARTDKEADIQKIAETSNTVREVVTEAMASVLEKQGKNDKAIELYKKLSFLNPDKSTYFAAKIKNLKGI